MKKYRKENTVWNFLSAKDFRANLTEKEIETLRVSLSRDIQQASGRPDAENSLVFRFPFFYIHGV